MYLSDSKEQSNKPRKNLVVWSGGLDSTAILLNLKANRIDFDTVYVRLKNNTEKSNAEIQAREKIEQIFNSDGTFFNDHIIDTQDYAGLRCNLPQPFIWLTNIFNLAEFGTYTHIYFGYIKGDCFWQFKNNFVEAFKNCFLLQGRHERDLPELVFNFQDTNKSEIINYYESMGYFGKCVRKEIWTCEYPEIDRSVPSGLQDKYTTCIDRQLGLKSAYNCDPCKNLIMADYNLTKKAIENDNNHIKIVHPEKIEHGEEMEISNYALPIMNTLAESIKADTAELDDKHKNFLKNYAPELAIEKPIQYEVTDCDSRVKDRKISQIVPKKSFAESFASELNCNTGEVSDYNRKVDTKEIKPVQEIHDEINDPKMDYPEEIFFDDETNDESQDDFAELKRWRALFFNKSPREVHTELLDAKALSAQLQKDKPINGAYEYQCDRLFRYFGTTSAEEIYNRFRKLTNQIHDWSTLFVGKSPDEAATGVMKLKDELSKAKSELTTWRDIADTPEALRKTLQKINVELNNKYSDLKQHAANEVIPVSKLPEKRNKLSSISHAHTPYK